MEQIFSMANYRGEGVSLPVNLWIDEGKEYVRGQHSKRIKFQLDYAKQIHEWNFAPMTLDGEVPVDINIPTNKITMKDVKMVRNFVHNNKYALDKLADMIIVDDEWKQVMIKGGKPATEEQIQEQKDKVDMFISNSEEDNVIE